MVGQRSQFRYEMTTADPISGRNCYINCDSDAIGLVINGQTNVEPSVQIDRNTFNFYIPSTWAKRGRSPRARYVVVRFTGVIPAGYSGDKAKVPALTPDFWNNCLVGRTGTFLGVPVVVDQQVDGVPTVNGSFS